MITENQVCDSVAAYLKAKGYKVEQCLTTIQCGVDIVAKSPNGKLCYIEAKGGTSSKAHTKKYGKPFSRGQAGTHISVAILKALQLSDQYKDEGAEVLGITTTTTNPVNSVVADVFRLTPLHRSR